MDKPEFPPISEIRRHSSGAMNVFLFFVGLMSVIALAIAIAVAAFIVFSSMDEKRDREIDFQRREVFRDMRTTLSEIK